MKTALAYRSLSDVSAMLQAREISSQSLTTLMLERALERNPEINCFIEIFADTALQRRDSGRQQAAAILDDVSTPRRKRGQTSLLVALLVPAAAKRLRSYPPPMPIAEGQVVVVESQLARPSRAAFVPPHNISPEQLHQEELREVVRTATIEARMAICMLSRTWRNGMLKSRKDWYERAKSSRKRSVMCATWNLPR